MKKILVSLAAALLLMLNTVPCAYAEYITIGSCYAGDEINCYISDVAADCQVTALSLPYGCTVVGETENGASRLYLRGKPVYAGSHTFTLELAGSAVGSIVCTLEVKPALPRITQSGNVNCSVGESVLLTVGASISDEGSLSYQWFYGNGGLIPGAIGNSYAPDTSAVGVSQFYCEVTNTNSGLTAALDSPLITVSVSEPVLQSISVASMPTKTQYNLGDSLDTAGLSVSLNYSNGRSSAISSGFGVYPSVFTFEGTQNVELSYQGMKCTFQVTVTKGASSIEGIGVVTLPKKTVYTEGERLETEGLSIRVYTPAGQYDVSDGLSCSPMLLETEGDQTVTVSYEGKTCTFKVKVESDEPEVKSVSVVQKPTLLDYTVGDRLDSTGLIIRVTTNKGTEDITTGFACTPKVLTTAGQQAITVVYGPKTCTFTVNVSARQTASPSPSVKPSSSPVPGASPSPGEVSASPVHTPNSHSSHETRAGNTLVKVIMVVAVIALVGLGAYVYIMQRRGHK